MTVTERKEEDQITLFVEGRVDTITSPTLQMTILNALQKKNSLTLDLSRAEYLSSAGLRALLIGEKTAKGKGGHMRVVHVPDSLMEVFILTKFSDILDITGER